MLNRLVFIGFGFYEHPMAVRSDGSRHHYFAFFEEKISEKFAGFKKMSTFASAFDKNA